MKKMNDMEDTAGRYRILYFMDNFKVFGGAANTLLNQAILMKNAGMKVAVALSENNGTGCCQAYLKICQKEQIDIFFTNYSVSSQPEDVNIFAVIEDYKDVKEIIGRFRPNLLHSVQLNPTVELVGRELQIPHVMNIYPATPDFFRLDYWDIFPHYHICDSGYYARIWEKYQHTRSFCVRTVVRAACERKRSADKTEKLKFLCVGSIYKEKNQLAAIKAVHQAFEAGIEGELYLYGYADGAYADVCREYVYKNHLWEKIFFCGFHDDMSMAYKSGDVLICASIRESYPNVISEALASGVVVISTPVGGVPEVIKNGFNGFLCNGYSDKDVFDCILDYVDARNHGRAEEIVQNAYDTYISEHSPDSVMERLLRVYGEIMNDGQWNKKRLQIGTIDALFREEIAQYRANASFFSDAKAVENKLWYLHYMKQIISAKFQDRTVTAYIWGAGKSGRDAKEMLQFLVPQVHVRGYIDASKSGMFCGLRIFSADEAFREKNVDIFLIALMNAQKEVCETLEGEGKTYCEDYFILAPRRW